ncbi:hypothetical protein [Hymenobacter glaciei]|uniref:hypothetical protein n=1 Tax=Hymenobacter glaciei TaxID=877209 RepID=UPI0031E83D39
MAQPVGGPLFHFRELLMRCLCANGLVPLPAGHRRPTATARSDQATSVAAK